MYLKLSCCTSCLHPAKPSTPGTRFLPIVSYEYECEPRITAVDHAEWALHLPLHHFTQSQNQIPHNGLQSPTLPLLADLLSYLSFYYSSHIGLLDFLPFLQHTRLLPPGLYVGTSLWLGAPHPDIHLASTLTSCLCHYRLSSRYLKLQTPCSLLPTPQLCFYFFPLVLILFKHWV